MSPLRPAALLLLGLGLAAPALAQPAGEADDAPLQAEEPKYMYMYTDDQGQLHAVDNLEAVPYRYRATATKIAQQGGRSAEQAEADDLERRKRESDRLILEARRERQEENRKRQAQEVEEARRKLADKEEERGPEKKDEADPAQRLRQLREELVRLEAQVGALEEGYSPGEDFDGMSGDQIEARLLNIEVRMKTIEKEIARIERR